jgi:uncharacterized protein YndB with AHSA1/START domain
MITLELRRTVAAPPEQVWYALTDPAAVNGWFWPHLDPSTEIDARVGGSYRFAGPAALIAVKGRYLEVDPPTRLVFTWQWDGDEPARDRYAQGWRDCLERLSPWLNP